MAALRLVPIYCGAQAELLEPLGDLLARTLGLAVDVHAPGFDPELCFDGSRGQYNSTLLLAQLLREPALEEGRVLGVAGVDLFIPVLTYVFGEAQLDGRAAVVSMHRLMNESYGLAPDRALLLARLGKEALHELGHTYGLVHCERQSCVMSRSTYVEEIDLKGEAFCGRCRAQVRAAC